MIVVVIGVSWMMGGDSNSNSLDRLQLDSLGFGCCSGAAIVGVKELSLKFVMEEGVVIVYVCSGSNEDIPCILLLKRDVVVFGEDNIV